MRKITLLIMITFCLRLVYAQEIQKEQNPNIRYDSSGNIEYIKFENGDKINDLERPTSFESFWKNILHVQGQNEFIAKTKFEREDGSFYEHYRQFYNGIIVEDGIYILHFRDGRIEKANGHYVNVGELITSPKLTPEDAFKSYAKYLSAPDSAPQDFFHELVIAEIEETLSNKKVYGSHLCYKINMLDHRADNGEIGYIDAQTGEVLKTVKEYDEYSDTGTFSTLYSETVTATTQYFNNVFNLCDSSRNAVIHTWDLNNTNYEYYEYNRGEFTDNDNTWTENEHSSNNDQMALDIHWALKEIYDYFDEEHDLQSYNNLDSAINAYVHAEKSDGNRDAAWYSSTYDAFFFGDGQNIVKPMGALDVVSHEYGHAITRYHTGLSNDYGVESSMKEGFSDIWGAIIENEIAPEKENWKIGEEIMDNGDDCLRNIEDPESNNTYDQMADTYGDATYTSGDFYAKSGIMSHWFYLLSEGGSGTNDNSDYYVVYGLGIDIAAQIVFEGQTGHFGSVDSYSEARTAMVDASEAIYGDDSFESLQVKNAWYAVGVGSDPGQVTYSGPSLICTSETFTLNNLPAGITVSWDESANLTENPVGTFTANGSGAGWVQAILTAGSGDITLPQKEVWVGAPDAPYNILCVYCYQYCVGQEYIFQVEDYNDLFTTSYYWSVNYAGHITYGQGGPSVSVYMDYPYQADISVYAYNTCGSSSVTHKYVYVSNCGRSLMVYPNPAKDEITFSIDEELELSKDAVYEITDNFMNKLVAEPLKTKEKTINISNLKTGLYYISIYTNGELITEKFMKD